MWKPINPWNNHFGRRMETLRLTLRISNQRLAEMLGLQYKTFLRMKKGTPPKIEYVRRLVALESEYADALAAYKKVHPEEMGGTPPVDPPPPSPPNLPTLTLREGARPTGREIATNGVDYAIDTSDRLGRSVFGYR